MATITELNIYPLKSGRAIPQQQVRLGITGFEWDRHWMASSSDGVFMSQRTQPRLARIVPELANNVLTLRAPEMEPLSVSAEPDGAARPARVWKDSITALDLGDSSALWLTQALEFDVR